MTANNESRIAITLGDPSGIGPEIVAMTLAAQPAMCGRVMVFGDRAALSRGAACAGVKLPDIDVCDPALLSVATIDSEAPLGQPTPAGARAQVSYLRHAIDHIRAGAIDTLCTAPISKTQAEAGGLGYPGHTDFLAHELLADPVAMMFVGPSLKVALATVHIPLSEVAARLTVDRIADVVALVARFLAHQLGVADPRIGVLGLNPHAGESGLLGKDEIEVIAPAIAAARARLGGTAHVVGPLVPDAAFRDARWQGDARPARTDALVALYHDQGLIPVKLIDFEHAVNLTLGLPIVRTSPDHGVAYDIAGHGTARPQSFMAALSLAATLSRAEAT